MNIKEIRALLELFREYGLTEVEVERGGDRIRLRREAVAVPAVAAPGPPPAAPAQTAAPAPEPLREDRRQHLVTVEAPMVGTFYRAPSPDAEPYVREGDVIKEAQVLCIIEAMKLMNEIESKVSGRIIRVLAENGQPVEYGQPLFLIEP
ncbi:MAG TPA: acetyl-CoA carboxylase biotin carboxyl carrier protein [Methylomirabilota bacterium]|jgi:acetyl-CoA carboxylase biotin carboxyl carrier protein|nr:acetyl-CoA carboxylase biotin carboxyl carrier protein [Methylomirabilota bacterium]